jgi:hypothetical protein
VRSGFNPGAAGRPFHFGGKLQKVSKTFRQGFRKFPKSANFFQILAENFIGKLRTYQGLTDESSG